MPADVWRYTCMPEIASCVLLRIDYSCPPRLIELFIPGEEYLMSPVNTDPAIKCVHVFSTGSGEQHKEHRYGSRLPVLWWILTSRSWIEVPINVYVLEHRDGLVLFDTGMDPAIGSDPNYISSAIGRFLLHRIFRLHITPEDALNKLLSRTCISTISGVSPKSRKPSCSLAKMSGCSCPARIRNGVGFCASISSYPARSGVRSNSHRQMIHCSHPLAVVTT